MRSCAALKCYRACWNFVCSSVYLQSCFKLTCFGKLLVAVLGVVPSRYSAMQARSLQTTFLSLLPSLPLFSSPLSLLFTLATHLHLTTHPPPPYQDLPFKKGDTLEIISASKDPNWYKARRSDGLEGMIPSNYVQEKRRVVEQPPPPAATRTPGAVNQPRGAVKLRSMP